MATKASKKMELSEEIPRSVVVIIIIGNFMVILDSSSSKNIEPVAPCRFYRPA